MINLAGKLIKYTIGSEDSLSAMQSAVSSLRERQARVLVFVPEGFELPRQDTSVGLHVLSGLDVCGR